MKPFGKKEWGDFIAKRGTFHRWTVTYIMSHPELQTEDPEFDAWTDRVIAALEAAKKNV